MNEAFFPSEYQEHLVGAGLEPGRVISPENYMGGKAIWVDMTGVSDERRQELITLVQSDSTTMKQFLTQQEINMLSPTLLLSGHNWIIQP
jgi:hypothetical protein